ncbi:MAG: 16S rRNA (guanine(527)-N(7))-methyltransferase RsmG [Oscillospiraceae bacterium]|nr:16S rRNA (guanine(527)-N(7))-methyltransferase RsmG [Oscillospiraceae bacterium]
MEEILRAGLEELGVEADGTAIERLRQYHSLLEETNKVMNLTAIRGEEETARLHFLDCAALLRYLPAGEIRVCDVGAGAGFPGLVLKILRPELRLTMLDSQQKRVAFQRRTADALGLEDVECIAGRAEEEIALRERFDAVTSRAVARLDMLCELCLPLVKPGGTFAAMKGPDAAEELREAERAVRLLGGGEARIETYAIPGTDIRHSAVLIPKVRPTPARDPRRFAVIKKTPL